ncbi:MAG: hypothetical protein BGP06_03695 [Rhizobiales bacterium 65-9]|nr:MAG: hypothetical protein BGP06_03695 [Rhizobiales bacterium 65-9]
MRAAALPWFARHEARLAWRDWLAMVQGGRRRRKAVVALAVALFVIFLHLLAYGLLQSHADALATGKRAFVALTGAMFLSWTLILSQAMESVTRSFYARADLDLLLSSPSPAAAIFKVRLVSIALGTAAMSMLFLGPVINALVLLGGWRFLSAYGVLAAMACSATGAAACLVALLFRAIGPRATRLASQIVAAIIGAAFVIGVQVVAIMAYGGMSRFTVLQSPELLAAAPAIDSGMWTLARAAMGDLGAMVVVLAASVAFLAGVVALISGEFARYSLATVGQSGGASASTARRPAFRKRSVAQTLRRKEWILLARDPWLLSQSLMQVLYLAPPALLLWRNFGGDGGALVILAPVLVMAAGQLAGGLAWLAISGEDAPDLVATAPVSARALLGAKIQAVMVAVAAPLAPLIAALAFASPWIAIVTAIGAACACGCATAIQIFFRSQARRAAFRRRQTSSRLATMFEALASISVAGAAGLAAAGSWGAVAPAICALAVVAAARALSSGR